MIAYDKRFFDLQSAVLTKKSNALVIKFGCRDNYSPEIPTLEKTVTKQVLDTLGVSTFGVEFEYSENETVQNTSIKTDALLNLQKFAMENPAVIAQGSGVDKALGAKNIEYLLGKPVTIRPIKIKYLKVMMEEQITGGTIFFLTKKEYKKKVTPTDENQSGEEIRPYWTFVLNDGSDTVQCVFFPSEKSRPKFEMLKDRTEVAVIGVHDKRGDRLSFRVTGVSFCSLSS